MLVYMKIEYSSVESGHALLRQFCLKELQILYFKFGCLSIIH